MSISKQGLFLSGMLFVLATSAMGKCSRYLSFSIHSVGFGWTVDQPASGDTVYLMPGDSFHIQLHDWGSCPFMDVHYTLNGDTIQTTGGWSVPITALGAYRFWEISADDSTITGFDVAFVIAAPRVFPNPLTFAPNVLLDGPCHADGSTLWVMHDSLRQAGLLPMIEPYSALGYLVTENPGAMATPDLFDPYPQAGWNVVDWVLVELRDPDVPTQIIASKTCLLRAVGNVTDVIGTSPFVTMSVPDGRYLIAIRHRNHLGVMTLFPAPLSGPRVYCDLRSLNMPTYGQEARKEVNMYYGTLWAGNAVLSTSSQHVKYAGAENDRDGMLQLLGGALTGTASGYHLEDVNLDGVVKYAGSSNDRDVVLQTIGGNAPTNVRSEQLP